MNEAAVASMMRVHGSSLRFLRIRLERVRLLAGGIGVVTLLYASPMRAQDTATIRVNPAVNAVVSRARAQLDAGDGAGARALLDSLVDGVESGSLEKGEALYWRAVLSEQATDAEKDWRRLIVDVPLSPRVADASLRLAELERARGRPMQARVHVVRLLRDAATSPLRARALLLMAQSYFDENDAPHACGVLTGLRAEMPAGQSEVQLQTDELSVQCRGVQAIAFSVSGDAPPAIAATGAAPVTTNTAAVPPTVPPATATASGRDSAQNAAKQPVVDPKTRPTPNAATKPPASVPVSAPPTTRATAPTTAPTSSGTASGRFTVQLAAYDQRDQADALVKRLTASGVDARVDGDVKPFRVRVGRYATQGEAAAALTKLKAKGHSGFVAEVAPR